VKSVFRLQQERHGRKLQSLVRKGQTTEALEVLQKMKDGKLKPDVVDYNSIISALSKLGEFKKAFKLFNEVRGIKTPNRASSICSLVSYIGYR